MAYDSDNIPLVTRLEAGTNVAVGFSVNSEGEGVYNISATTDSEVVKNMVFEHAGTAVAALRSDLDSETTRIQTLLTRAETAVSRLDSDESNIQALKTQLVSRLDSDSSSLQALATTVKSRLDSDSIVIQALKATQDSLKTSLIARLDSDEASIQALRSEVRSRLDSDSNLLQSLATNVVSRLDSDSTFIQTLATAVKARLDSDESSISALKKELIARLDSDTAAISFNTANAGHDSESIVSMITEHGGSDFGSEIQLGTPTQDGSLSNETGAIALETTDTVTDAIDRLNEATRNVLRNTAVANIDFTGDNLVGGAGFTTTLTVTADGNPNRYDIHWGDGTVDSDSSDSTPSHVYNSNVGSPFTVRVIARNSSGEGAGSFSTKTRTNYVTVFTATPAVSFAIYAASSGGSPITQWDDGDTIYIQNNTTNTSNAIASYSYNFGDSDQMHVVDSDRLPGGSVLNGGTRLPYTFDTVTETDRRFNISLTLNAHTTANPADIPRADSDNFFNILDTHTPSVSINDSDGINEEGTSGHVIQATNNSGAGVGSFATFGSRYVYVWGDGTSNTTVNAGSGSAGDRGASAVSHTYTLPDSDQANGHTVTYTGKLQITSNHDSSPFESEDFVITVRPDLRVNYAATAVTVSDRGGDDSRSLYNFTDLTGANRALVRATNTSQNATNLTYIWGDGDSDSLTENGSSPGSLGATIDHDYTGESNGNYDSILFASGTPGGVAQTDKETIRFTIKAVPDAPDNLSTYTLTLSDAAQGSSPKLAASFTDNTGSMPTLSAGTSLNSTVARRYTSGTIDTNVINNSYNGAAGELYAIINGDSDGGKVFSTSSGETGTFGALVISQQGDAHDTINSSTYPSNFYQTFDAKITKALTGYTLGLNAQKLRHSQTGETSVVHVLRDDTVTAAPTISNAGTVSVNNAGTYRYISGVPYFNTGSPTINVAGIQVTNFVGQAYSDTSSPVEIDSGTNQEGTSSAGTVNTNYTYGNVDGASTFLSGGVPVANTGVGSAYTLGTLSVAITSSSVRTVDRIQIRATNVNGTGSYVENTKNINVHTAAQSGINETAISVSNGLGSGFTDNGVRSGAFKSATTDTPALRGGSYNYYNTDIFAEDSDSGVQGTKEATIRLGVLKHDTTDYSAYVPVGPNRSGDTGTQYFTMAFRRTAMANFTVNIVSTTGIEGMFIAAPGTAIDSASSLNGWLDCGAQYAGAGVPGANSGSGGNGSNGCASTGGDVIGSGALSGAFTFTLGTENATNATNNVILLRIALASGDTVTSLSIS